MRLLWHSHSPLAATGYGKPTALWLPKLRDMGYEIMGSAFFGQDDVIHYQGIPVVNTDDGKYGATVLRDIAIANDIDAVITLMDVWAFDPVALAGMKAFHWFPVDTDPLSALDEAFFKRSQGVPVSISQQGQRLLAEAGFKGFSVPYAYDQRVFCPDDEQRNVSREEQGLADKFVVGINASDVPRKAWSEQLSAFARLQRKHPGEVTLLANTTGDTPVQMAREMRIPEDAILWSSGLDEQKMVSWYRTLDVLAACSYAEGFGLPIIEAQACGTPVIVTDAPPVNEEPGLLGHKVACTPIWNAAHHAYWNQPSVRSLHEALEHAFLDNDRNPAIADYVSKYSVDVIAEQWKAILDQ